ncbi:hypothetical protein [Spiroplasma diminutum]|uniref:Uncharacterized protein n=1 Tax=Spiroplasma diminutum CUAS-1 TaxID=1276221 RepID=S5MEM0_9MOLU|nr:hypothetical protein [Spiroplasma diminutum]AGR42188.1 hypothetical protein SDIMI_v3c04840 [Spiroplasma diminutum CUAS-1]
MKLKKIDKNYSLVGVFKSKKIENRGWKIQSTRKIKDRYYQNLNKIDIYVVNNKRLRQTIGSVTIKDSKILKYSIYPMISKSRKIFIKLIQTGEIYKLTDFERKHWELYNQFSDIENKRNYNPLWISNKLDLRRKKIKEYSKDIDELISNIEKITDKSKFAINKINVLNSKAFLSKEDEVLKICMLNKLGKLKN